MVSTASTLDVLELVLDVVLNIRGLLVIVASFDVLDYGVSNYFSYLITCIPHEYGILMLIVQNI